MSGRGLVLTIYTVWEPVSFFVSVCLLKLAIYLLIPTHVIMKKGQHKGTWNMEIMLREKRKGRNKIKRNENYFIVLCIGHCNTCQFMDVEVDFGLI